jgi:hypothetical protein
VPLPEFVLQGPDCFLFLYPRTRSLCILYPRI